MARFVLGVSGASGVVLGYRCLGALSAAGHEVELVMTSHAVRTAQEELPALATPEAWRASLPAPERDRVVIRPCDDLSAPIASGSYQVDGMIIMPCSMATVAAVAGGLADTLLRRAADVTLKERRPLIMVPRETPLGEIHLENMWRLSRRGVVLVPPIPAWYTHPQTIEEVENFIVGRVLDVLRLPHALYRPWRS